MAGLTKLTYLSLAGNIHLNGTIGPVAGLTKLTFLGLGACGFGGPIDAVKGLSELTYLALDNNPKLTGTIEAVAGLTKLTSLYLESCDFSGVVPSGPIDWSKLTGGCQLQGNHFSCPLPPGAKDHCAATCN